MTTREGKKWSVNETLRLQREYELLELDVYDISKLHERSVRSILFRLQKEGFIEDFVSARGYEPEEPEEVVEKELFTVTDPASVLTSCIDTILEQKLLNIDEIQQCVSEKLESLRKKSKKPKRVLRQYK